MNSRNNSDNNTGLGNVLKLLRIAREMTTKELATKMDVSSTYISEVEANNKKPSLDMLSKYSKALDVNKSTILYFDEEREKNGYNYQKLLLRILQEIIKKDE
ncbi:MAG: helix-turn-helix domain-containing protein [Acetobacter sp.]|nr:helix-turn-helix domain-containing protein [Bacteroides sp.]MCM1340909.1 helix-turn-helix domain-containing protein [Acetobacter sp.]MCM1432535.1 helix-turn-helix domain-containing protein [Clostridiales bacterium]